MTTPAEKAARALLGCNTRAPIADGESSEWVAVSREHLDALRAALDAPGEATRRAFYEAAFALWCHTHEGISPDDDTPDWTRERSRLTARTDSAGRELRNLLASERDGREGGSKP